MDEVDYDNDSEFDSASDSESDSEPEIVAGEVSSDDDDDWGYIPNSTTLFNNSCLPATRAQFLVSKLSFISRRHKNILALYFRRKGCYHIQWLSSYFGAPTQLNTDTENSSMRMLSSFSSMSDLFVRRSYQTYENPKPKGLKRQVLRRINELILVSQVYRI